MKRLCIFDLDGTLLNSIADLADATNAALTDCGFPTHPVETYPMMVGNGITRLIERALPEECRDERTVSQVRSRFTAHYDACCCNRTRPYDGIPALLRALTDRKVAVAVASNKYQDAVTRIIAHFFPGVPWVAVEGQKEGVPTKPDPSVVFEILGKHPTPKAEVIYCGDSAVDVETAHRACIESVAVTWGFRPLAELEAALPDHIITTPSALLPLL